MPSYKIVVEENQPKHHLLKPLFRKSRREKSLKKDLNWGRRQKLWLLGKRGDVRCCSASNGNGDGGIVLLN
jgi:hypothetical protein